MQKSLTFKCGDGSGRFARSWKAERLVDKLLEDLQDGRISDSTALKKALPTGQSEPENLELQNFIAGRYWALDMKDEAFKVWLAAYDIAQALIPPKFSGKIDWYDLPNRPFLRVCHGLILSYLDQREGKKALALCNRVLKWVPGDNLGVRFLRPDALELAGKHAQALKAHEEIAPEYGVAYYKIARFHFSRANFVQACTALRRGIIENVYVAEAILGRMSLINHLYWHGTSRAMADEATDFIDSHEDLLDPAFVDFTDWVFNCAAVLRERAVYMAHHEDLTFLRPGKERSDAIDAFDFVRRSFDPKLSEAIVALRKNRWDQDYYPWDREALDHRLPTPKSTAAPSNPTVVGDDGTSRVH